MDLLEEKEKQAADAKAAEVNRETEALLLNLEAKYKALEDAQTEANETAYQRQNFNEGWMLPVRHLGKIDSAEVWASIDEHCAATGEPLRGCR